MISKKWLKKTCKSCHMLKKKNSRDSTSFAERPRYNNFKEDKTMNPLSLF